MHYTSELHIAVKGLIGAKQSFDVTEIKSLVETLLSDDGKYHDPIKERDLRNTLISMFERGRMPGYCLVTKPVIDEDGPKILLEFAPENPMAEFDLIGKPEKDGKKTICVLHPYHKKMLKEICRKVECSQDLLVRSIIIKALTQINDQLK